jgi:hypothetical protein
MQAHRDKADGEAKVRQGEADSEAKTCQEHLKEEIKGHMKALLEGLRCCERRTTACQVSAVACPEKSKASPEGTEAAVDIFDGSSDKMEATNSVANPEATKAVVERLELREHLAITATSMGEEADSRQCWVPAEVVGHPCSAKGTYS